MEEWVGEEEEEQVVEVIIIEGEEVDLVIEQEIISHMEIQIMAHLEVVFLQLGQGIQGILDFQGVIQEIQEEMDIGVTLQMMDWAHRGGLEHGLQG